MATVQRDDRTPPPGRPISAADAARLPAGPRAGAAHVDGVDRRAGLRGALLGAHGAGRRALTLRPAGPHDAHDLAVLGEHDPGRPPAAPLLVAEQDGVVVAAIGVLDRRVRAREDAHVAVDRLQAAAAERRAALRAARWRRALRLPVR